MYKSLNSAKKSINPIESFTFYPYADDNCWIAVNCSQGNFTEEVIHHRFCNSNQVIFFHRIFGLNRVFYIHTYNNSSFTLSHLTHSLKSMFLSLLTFQSPLSLLCISRIWTRIDSLMCFPGQIFWYHGWNLSLALFLTK